MQKFFFPAAFIFSFIIACFISCSESSEIEYTSIALEDTYSDTDSGVFYPSTSGYVDLSYTLDLGSSEKDVYFVLTNRSLSSSTSLHDFNAGDERSPDFSQALDIENEDISGENTDHSFYAQRGSDGISDYNRRPISSSTSLSQAAIELQSPQYAVNDAVDDEQTFMIEKDESVEATCQYTDTISTDNGDKTLNIWVADDCWYDGGTKSYKISPAMVTALADEFLLAGTDNDIYDWVSTIFGEEWGTHGYGSQLIQPDDNITILLFDIDGDDNAFLSKGYVAGYFYSKDNFLTSDVSFSNERIMFYIDAVAFAYPDNTWGITDPLPADTVLTLAHELQHMIHFYQKNVTRVADGSGTQTWINEMCSLITEDLMCQKLGAAFYGPRGIPGNNPGDVNSPITKGWLPYYAYYDDRSLTLWGEDDLALDYCTAYAAAAYLARNYGGTELFRNIVHNGYTDVRAVTEPIEDMTGEAVTFETILRMWGAAMLLSDTVYDSSSPGVFEGLIMNNGDSDWFESTVSGDTYYLGSINIDNYSYKVNGYTRYGLKLYTPSTISSSGKLPASANRYVRVSESATGVNTWNILLDKNTRLTVVVK
ncbi:MAG TPA: hypothetical protein PK859_03255 [Spirochaetota bacterium]|nr:hypothetical protein [Spirochaetota bacterium]HPR47766.1 hypothetical protein [Spirochaetota bacterium]